jgi:hypothetical protein
VRSSTASLLVLVSAGALLVGLYVVRERSYMYHSRLQYVAGRLVAICTEANGAIASAKVDDSELPEHESVASSIWKSVLLKQRAQVRKNSHEQLVEFHSDASHAFRVRCTIAFSNDVSVIFPYDGSQSNEYVAVLTGLIPKGSTAQRFMMAYSPRFPDRVFLSADAGLLNESDLSDLVARIDSTFNRPLEPDSEVWAKEFVLEEFRVTKVRARNAQKH